MNRSVLVTAMMTMSLWSSMASAEIRLVGIGKLDHSAKGRDVDLSSQRTTLENGLPSNLLGGLGSGFAYAGEDRFLALPDRGPNALPYNGSVDDTTSFVSRFHSLRVKLAETKDDASLPVSVTVDLTATTPFFSAAPLNYAKASGSVPTGTPRSNSPSHYYFSGRSDNFNPVRSSMSEGNGRFDPEGLRVSNDGKSVYVSDEYGPYLRQFDRATGRLVRSIKLPAKLAIGKLSPRGDDEIALNPSGRTANKGMEGLAITPDGKVLIGAVQAALLQDASDPATKKLVRLVRIDIGAGTVEEFAYPLTDGSGVSEVLAINSHELLLLERDGAGLGDPKPTAVTKRLYRVDLADAVDITHTSGPQAATVALKKTLALDIVKALADHGIEANQVPAKLEGIAFGPDTLVRGKMLHTLFITNDNDFKSSEAGPNLIYVFGFDGDDLPGFEPQRIRFEIP